MNKAALLIKEKKETKDNSVRIRLTDKMKEDFQSWCNKNNVKMSLVIQNMIKQVLEDE